MIPLTAISLHFSKNEWILIDHFYKSVLSLYMAFMMKLKSKFDFKSPILTNPKRLNPIECQSVSLNTFDEIHASIPIKFDKAATKL